jgi:general secretion pathway protein A
MYLEFYKFREFPFSITCDERFFYESDIHAEALANMMYTVQQRKGMVLITGEVGAGKTFVGNVLCNRLGARCLAAVMSNPPGSAKQLIRSVAAQVGMSTRRNADRMLLIEDLQEHLTKLWRRGRLVTVIVDEAQDLPNSSLEEVRLLWNWEQEGQRLVQIVLIGQPELRQKIREPKWEPLRQRIVLSYHLRNLSERDTKAYIQHRIRVAADEGCQVGFTPEAIAEIFAATDGTPRLINVLCDNALLIGYAKELQTIDRSVVVEVIRDMTCWGLRSPSLSGSSDGTLPRQ